MNLKENLYDLNENGEVVILNDNPTPNEHVEHIMKKGAWTRRIAETYILNERVSTVMFYAYSNRSSFRVNSDGEPEMVSKPMPFETLVEDENGSRLFTHDTMLVSEAEDHHKKICALLNFVTRNKFSWRRYKKRYTQPVPNKEGREFFSTKKVTKLEANK